MLRGPRPVALEPLAAPVEVGELVAPEREHGVEGAARLLDREVEDPWVLAGLRVLDGAADRLAEPARSIDVAPLRGRDGRGVTVRREPGLRGRGLGRQIAALEAE